MSTGATIPGGGQTQPPEEKMDKSLQKENKKLKGEIKQMEIKIKTMQVELNKSYQMKDKLEGLCRELQKQNKFIKAESSSKIQEANIRGKELASEVQNNMGFMKSINENLAAISSESLNVKKENEELAKKIAILKGHYEEREQILQSALKETHESLKKGKLDLGETKLKNAEDKEKLLGEMQKLADALIQSRDQLKASKETELSLRNMIQSYEEKFNDLQKSLKDTNGSYHEFKGEMNKVSYRTKELEKETIKWQKRFEESNNALARMKQNYQKVTDELSKSQDSLDKMKSLCRMLHTDNRNLQTEIKSQKGETGNEVAPLSEAAAATLAAITNDTDILAEPSSNSKLSKEIEKTKDDAKEMKENQTDMNKTASLETIQEKIPIQIKLESPENTVMNQPQEFEAANLPSESAEASNISSTIEKDPKIADPPTEAKDNKPETSSPTAPTTSSEESKPEDDGGKSKKNKRRNKKK